MAVIRKVRNVTEFMNLAIRDIESNAKKSLNDFIKDAKQQLYNFTNDWYNAKPENPDSYKRTYEFINSITISTLEFNNGKWEIGLYFDPTKMSISQNGNWIQHEDRYYLSEIIENGWQYRNDGSEAIFKTADWAEIGAFSKALLSHFKKNGYRIKQDWR